MKKNVLMGALPGVLAMSAAMGGLTTNERRLGRFLRDPENHPEPKVKSAEQLADELRKSIETKQGEVLKKADAALAEAKSAGKLSEETKASVDEALTGINVLREQLTQIEAKMATKPGTGDGQSYGEQFAKSDKFAQFKAGGFQGSVRVAFDMKAVTAALAGTSWSQRDPEVTGLPKRELTVRDLLTVVPTGSGSIDYARQTVRTNAAAVVAEAAAKPYSAYEWEQVTATVRVIAHLAKITRQALDDAVQLQGEIEQEMRYGLAIAEEGELLTGDGTGQHLSGLITNATAYSAPTVLDDPETSIDTLRLALLQAELALYPTDGIVLNPIDWTVIELTKDSTGGYIFAQPQGMAGPRLWAKPVVSTPAMTVDKFLVGGFKLQTLYDRMAPEVLIASENQDDFEKNLYTMRCEERLALAVKKPGALIYGDFGRV